MVVPDNLTFACVRLSRASLNGIVVAIHARSVCCINIPKAAGLAAMVI